MSNETLVPCTKIVVATCNLNQWALDFDRNYENIVESIRIAKEKGAKFRVGPELEISGYSCEDHFFEGDTYLHSEQVLSQLLSNDVTHNILCDIGCPLIHNNVRYNCRVFCLNGKILMIRPKMFLADDGNYRERRFFTGWKESQGLQDFLLSEPLRRATGQTTVPFGIGIIATKETKVASEVCEELWTPNSPHIRLFMAGAEIISNASGSHHQLRKLDSRLNLIRSATRKCGGVYLYANLRGCDGTRLYFDGSSLISLNGEIIAQASQFSLNDVEVVTAIIDLNDVRAHRNGINSLQEQFSEAHAYPIIDARHFSLVSDDERAVFAVSSGKIDVKIYPPEEECALGPACWLWDYLRRSGATGFILPLSGGADSASVATIVYAMCKLAVDAANNGNQSVITVLDTILFQRNSEENVARQLTTDTVTTKGLSLTTTTTTTMVGKYSVTDLCNCLLHTVYLGTVNSSQATRNRALTVANSIGSYHNACDFDSVVAAALAVFGTMCNGRVPKFQTNGGTYNEDIALQNIQARLRMVLTYLCAQLFPWLRGKKGFLLVLGAGNVDESLRGYMTKYDCSSADLNPIGGICKGDLKRLLLWAGGAYQLPILHDIVNAAPTAELRPIEGNSNNDNNSNYSQNDEEEMGMSYDELGVFGALRKMQKCGPVSMFLKLLSVWNHLSPDVIADKVKKFFYYYAVNRHKLTTLTPSYHAEDYSTDDNRFDLRPFIYNNKWPRQFHCIDELVKSYKKAWVSATTTPK